jgi:hypothetical protein
VKTRTVPPIGAVLTALALVGCVPKAASTPSSSTPSGSHPAAGTLAPDNSAAPMPAAGTCHLGQRNGQPLPDPACTPGAINPMVPQDNINDTICKSGWTKTVRPSSSKTNRMKAVAATAYSLTADTQGEYDHLLSGAIAAQQP